MTLRPLHPTHERPLKGGRERGFLLLAVLVIVMLASMVVLSLLFRLRAEQAGFQASMGTEQAWAAVNSGVQQAMHVVTSAPLDPSVWENNPALFRHQLVVDDGSDRWYFTLYSPPKEGDTELRYGLIDEARKLNLNVATAEMLSKATALGPQLIQEIAGDNPLLTNAVDTLALAHQQFSTFDELLRLPSCTPGFLYGEDANHNFKLDPNEDDGRLQFPPDDADGRLFLGLQETATVWTYEFDIASDGSPRLQLNSPKPSVPEFVVPPQTMAFIQAAWENRRLFRSPAELLEAKEKFKNADGKEVEVESGVGVAELPAVLDQLTTTFAPKLTGLVNVNTASIQVLQAVPGLTQAHAEAIIQVRESLPIESRQSIAWLYRESILNAADFKAVAPFLTARSYQFRFNAIGYALPSGRFRVFEIVIDTADRQPRILYARDITRFGVPFALAPSETPVVPTNL